MTAVYTFDVFTSLDGFGAASANWSGYWGKQGPELLDHRLAQYGPEQRRSSGQHVPGLRTAAGLEPEQPEVLDPWVTRMRTLPTTVVSTTLEDPLDWPNATVASGDAVDVVARPKEESGVPLRSHGSLSMNRALMAAGLVDRVQVTLFPVITGQTGLDRIFEGAPTSTWSCSRAARDDHIRSSSTDPLCIDRWTVRPTPSPPGTKVHSSHPRRRADRLLCSRSTRGTLTHFGHDRRCCQQELSSPSNRGGSLLDGSRWAAR